MHSRLRFSRSISCHFFLLFIHLLQFFSPFSNWFRFLLLRFLRLLNKDLHPSNI